MIDEKEFINLLKRAYNTKELHDFIQGNEVEYILELIYNNSNNQFSKDLLKQIIDNSEKQVSFDLISNYVKYRYYVVDENTPNYVFSSPQVIENLLYYSISKKEIIINKGYEYGGLTPDIFKTASVNSNELLKYPKILSDIRYAKTIIDLNIYNATYLDESVLTNEIIDYILSKGYSFTPLGYNTPLSHNKYFILKSFENKNDYLYNLILNELENNPNFFSKSELEYIVDTYFKREKYINEFILKLASYDINLYIRIFETNPNLMYRVNAIDTSILSDESNNLVYRFIDMGYSIDSSSNDAIKNNINYVNYYFNKHINDEKRFWVKYVGKKIIDDPSNGFVINALRNGFQLSDFDSSVFSNEEYVKESLLHLNSSSLNYFFNQISDELLLDTSNGIVFDLIDMGLEFRIFNAKEKIRDNIIYLEKYIDSFDKFNCSIVDNMNPNVLLENKNLYYKAVDKGYKLSNARKESLFFKCVEFIKYSIEKVDNDYLLQNILNKVDEKLLINDSNNIISLALSMGMKYNPNNILINHVIYNNPNYMIKLINNLSSSFDIGRLINNADDIVYSYEDVIMLAIKKDYIYENETNKLMYTPNYLKEYIEVRSQTGYIGNNLDKEFFSNMPDDIINDSSNGVIKKLIDCQYILDDSTDKRILNNPDYIKYYARVNLGYLDNALKYIDRDILDDSLVYDILDCGYEINDYSLDILKNNYDYLTYGADIRRVSSILRINETLIDEKLARKLITNRVKISEELAEKYNLISLYYSVFKYYFKKGEKDKEFLSFIDKMYLKKDEYINSIPSEYLQDKEHILCLIYTYPNVIDIVDEKYLDKELISVSFKENYIIDDIDKFIKYVDILGGIEKAVRYNPNIIQYFSKEQFEKVFKVDYQNIIEIGIKFEKDLKKYLVELPDNLNNYVFISNAISMGIPDIINKANFDIDLNLFKSVISRGINLYYLRDNLKANIVNNDELFNYMINNSSNFKLVNALDIFIPKYIESEKLDTLIDKISKGCYISDKKKLKDNLIYLQSKNKEVFINLDIAILSDKYSFLGIETINRIIPDKSVVRKLLEIRNDNKLKIFKLCITYLYSIDISINVNDILSRILDNLYENKYNDMCNNIIDKCTNIDNFIDVIAKGKTKGNNIEFINNLVNVLLVSNNIYNITSISDLKNIYSKKCEYFNNLELTNDIDFIRNNILLKYYNININTAKFIYERYCYLQKTIDKISDVNLKKVLYDIKFLFECDDINYLVEIYNNLDISNIDFSYSVQLEGLIRNEFSSSYNEVFKNNTMVKLDDNIFELENDISLLIHVLGGYNHSYREPENFKKEWNIELMTNHGICTSYITNENLTTAPANYPILVFTQLEPNSILLSSPDDIVSNNFNQKYDTSKTKACRFLFPQEQKDETRWHHNEVVLERKKLSGDFEYKRQPNYILFIADGNYINEDCSLNIDNIKSSELWRMTKKASENFNVPILIINKAKVAKREHEQINDMTYKIVNENDYTLINKVITRYINNLMGKNIYFKTSELDEFINSVISLCDNASYEDCKVILENVYYTIMEENRKFNDHKTREAFNYVAKYQQLIEEKINNLNNIVK